MGYWLWVMGYRQQEGRRHSEYRVSKTRQFSNTTLSPKGRSVVPGRPTPIPVCRRHTTTPRQGGSVSPTRMTLSYSIPHTAPDGLVWGCLIKLGRHTN